eukprot:GHVS01025131.1.p1 GENE.GHVS01025131.1~~GHVS01025131.1.p1  ORF type:complete len:524 (-),score=103.48 GHVS01025131.1:374-1945(-)
MGTFHLPNAATATVAGLVTSSSTSASLSFCPLLIPPLHHPITTSLVSFTLAAAVHVFMATAALLVFRSTERSRRPRRGAGVRHHPAGRGVVGALADGMVTAEWCEEDGQERSRMTGSSQSSVACWRTVLLGPVTLVGSLLVGMKAFLRAGVEQTAGGKEGGEPTRAGGGGTGRESTAGTADTAEGRSGHQASWAGGGKPVARCLMKDALCFGRQENGFCLWVWFFCLGCAVTLLRAVDEGWLVSRLWILPADHNIHTIHSFRQYDPLRRLTAVTAPNGWSSSSSNISGGRSNRVVYSGGGSLPGVHQFINLTDHSFPSPSVTKVLPSLPPVGPLFECLLLILQACRHYCLSCALFDTKQFLCHSRRSGPPVRRVRVSLFFVLVLYMFCCLLTCLTGSSSTHPISLILFLLLRLSGLYFLSSLAIKDEVFSSYRDSRQRSSCGHLIVGASLLLIELFPLDVMRLVVRRSCGPGGLAGADVVAAVEVVGTLCLFANVGEEADSRVDRQTADTMKRMEETFDLDPL